MIFYLAKSYKILTILEYGGIAKEDASNTEIWPNTLNAYNTVGYRLQKNCGEAG